MSQSEITTLPPTMKALVVDAVGEPLRLKTVPTPQATPGSVVVKVICASLTPGLLRVLGGKTPFTFPTPMTPGANSIGRVVQPGPDTTSLAPGQLVLLDPFVRARDDPTVQMLWGLSDGGSPASKKLAANWPAAAQAEYVRAPLENVYPLDEAALCGKLGYTPRDLVYLVTEMVPYGGFASVGLRAGERVIVAPATGLFTGSAVPVALAMGANVVAASRNVDALRRLQARFPKGRVEIVQLKGEVEADAAALRQFGPVDVFLDLSPWGADGSTHVRSCFEALRPYGRAALMGVLSNDVAVPYATAMFKSLTIRGQYMYEREDARNIIKMAEAGVLKLGKEGGVEIKGEFKLEDIEEAFKVAAASTEAGQLVVLTP